MPVQLSSAVIAEKSLNSCADEWRFEVEHSSHAESLYGDEGRKTEGGPLETRETGRCSRGGTADKKKKTMNCGLPACDGKLKHEEHTHNEAIGV